MTHRANDGQCGFEIGNSESALDALIRHSGDCVKVVDLDGRVLKWNNACEEVYGWPAREVLGTVLPQIPEELRLKMLSEIRDIAGAGLVVERDVEAQRADGTRLSMRIVWIPLTDSDGDSAGLLTVAREMLADARLDRQREEFVSFVGAALTDPLATITNAANLLQRSEVIGDAERRVRLARTIGERARSVSGLVDDLLLTSELGRSELVLDREPANLVAVVNDSIEMLGERSSRITVDFDAAMPPVLVDVLRIQRATAVLMDKALRQTPEGRNVAVSVFAKGGYAVVEVRDQGMQIESSETERMFDRHYAGGEVRGSGDAGTGLYLVRGIAEAHGGRVAITGGNGVAFTIMLPIAKGGS